ncbi:hypothetical protein Ancab_040543 [Ancistrocladus abbreviatus]
MRVPSIQRSRTTFPNRKRTDIPFKSELDPLKGPHLNVPEHLLHELVLLPKNQSIPTKPERPNRRCENAKPHPQPLSLDSTLARKHQIRPRIATHSLHSPPPTHRKPNLIRKWTFQKDMINILLTTLTSRTPARPISTYHRSLLQLFPSLDPIMESAPKKHLNFSWNLTFPNPLTNIQPPSRNPVVQQTVG